MYICIYVWGLQLNLKIRQYWWTAYKNEVKWQALEGVAMKIAYDNVCVVILIEAYIGAYDGIQIAEEDGA